MSANQCPANEPIRFSPGDVRAYYSARLPDLRQSSASEWRGPCPIHQGKRDSFSVNSETGIWHCHSTCERGGDILDLEQALTSSDFPTAKQAVFDLIGRVKPVTRTNKKVVATYDYRDEESKLLFQAVRYEPKGFSQRRPDGEGGWIYKLADTRLVPYHLPELLAAPMDQPIFIVEGERDCHTLEAMGFVATCNPMGAGKWRAEYNQHFHSRRVVICPDNDAPGRKHGQQVYDHLRRVTQGIRFCLIPAPHKDVTDWHAATNGTIDDLYGFAADALPSEPASEPAPAATPATPPSDDPLALEFAPQQGEHTKLSPNDLAVRIMRENHFLRTREGYLYSYNSRHWEPVQTAHLTALAMKHDSLRHTTAKRRNEVANFIATAVHQPHTTWRKLELYEVPAYNGIVDIRTGALRPHRREDFLETTAAHAYDPTAFCGRWRKALGQYFGDDPDMDAKHDALQEFFGYCLMPHARYKKALLLLGDSNTGKSAVTFVIRELVGSHNVCGLSVDDMDDPRKRAPIMGKMVNLLTELTNDAVIADGGFKTLVSTEEGVQIDEKYLPSITYTPVAKHVIAANSLPRINDKSRGTFNRLLLIKFNRVLPQSEQESDIWDQLRNELPGILVWAIEGAKRLYENNGKFTKIQESEAGIEDYRLSENPINEFIEEKCERDEEGAIPTTEFWTKYCSWLDRKIDRRSMAAMIDSAGLKRKHATNPNTGKPVRSVLGLRWRDEIGRTFV